MTRDQLRTVPFVKALILTLSLVILMLYYVASLGKFANFNVVAVPNAHGNDDGNTFKYLAPRTTTAPPTSDTTKDVSTFNSSMMTSNSHPTNWKFIDPDSDAADAQGEAADDADEGKVMGVDEGDEEKGWHVLFGRDEGQDRVLETCNGKTKFYGRSKLALLTISHRTDGKSGPRPHAVVTAKWMKKYANKVGADFHVVDTLCVKTVGPEVSSNALNVSLAKAKHLYSQVSPPALARMQKLLIGSFLNLYERILLLDDTVMIHPRSPDLFQVVPHGTLGAVFERPKLRLYFPNWLKWRTRAFCAHYLESKCPGAEFMFNSGILLFDNSMQNTLFDAHFFHKYKYVMYFYDQAYFNAMVAAHDIKVFDLGVSFNRVGSTITASPKKQVWLTGLRNKQVCMPHMTRAVKNRMKTALKFDKMYTSSLTNSSKVCLYECGQFGCWVPNGPLPKPTSFMNISLVPLPGKKTKLSSTLSSSRWTKG